MLNLNKRGITLNLGTPQGAQIFTALVRHADVVIETFPPGYLASLGLDYAALERANPRIVLTSITPFGQTGPYRHYQGQGAAPHPRPGARSPACARRLGVWPSLQPYPWQDTCPTLEPLGSDHLGSAASKP